MAQTLIDKAKEAVGMGAGEADPADQAPAGTQDLGAHPDAPPPVDTAPPAGAVRAAEFTVDWRCVVRLTSSRAGVSYSYPAGSLMHCASPREAECMVSAGAALAVDPEQDVSRREAEQFTRDAAAAHARQVAQMSTDADKAAADAEQTAKMKSRGRARGGKGKGKGQEATGQ